MMKWEERRVSKTSLGLQSLLLTTFKKKKRKASLVNPKAMSLSVYGAGNSTAHHLPQDSAYNLSCPICCPKGA